MSDLSQLAPFTMSSENVPVADPSQKPSRGDGAGQGPTITKETIEALQKNLSREATPRMHQGLPPLTAQAKHGSMKEQALSFVPMVGGILQRAVMAKREEMVNDIASKVQTLISIKSFYEDMGGSPEEISQKVSSDPRVQAIFADKKFQKGMSKVFGGGFLEPEKQNTVFHAGFAKGMKLHEAEQQVRQAKQNQQQAQQQTMQQIADFFNKLPQTYGSPDPKRIQEAASPLEIAARDKERAESRTQLVYGRDSVYRVSKQAGAPAEEVKDTSGKGIMSERSVHDQNMEKNAAARVQLGKDTLKMRLDTFKQTDAYRKWKAKMDNDTKLRIASMNAYEKPAAALQSVAVFARGGLHQLDTGMEALARLQSEGVLTGALSGHVQDAIFGKGWAAPGLTAEQRKDLGVVRAAFGYTSSAAMRAHTGRTSREIYEDFMRTNSIAQDTDALYGSLDQTRAMLNDYANVVTPEGVKSLHQPEGSNKRRVIDLTH